MTNVYTPGVVEVSNRPFEERKHEHTSLYTWARIHLSDKIASKRHSFVSFSLYKEDGYILNSDLYNENFNIPQYDENYKKKVLYKIEEIITSIKEARVHERALLYVKRQGISIANYPFEEIDVYIISRFNDKEYDHPTHGKRIKQMIRVDYISTKYLKEYINHFTITGKVAEISKNPILNSVITVEKIDFSKVDNLKEYQGENSEIYIHIKRSLNLIATLHVYYTALSNEDKQALQQLLAVGHPNYVITPDMRLKVHLKGNNPCSFYVDSIES